MVRNVSTKVLKCETQRTAHVVIFVIIPITRYQVTWRKQTVNDVLLVGRISVPEYRMKDNPHEVDTGELEYFTELFIILISNYAGYNDVHCRESIMLAA